MVGILRRYKILIILIILSIFITAAFVLLSGRHKPEEYNRGVFVMREL